MVSLRVAIAAIMILGSVRVFQLTLSEETRPVLLSSEFAPFEFVVAASTDGIHWYLATLCSATRELRSYDTNASVVDDSLRAKWEEGGKWSWGRAPVTGRETSITYTIPTTHIGEIEKECSQPMSLGQSMHLEIHGGGNWQRVRLRIFNDEFQYVYDYCVTGSGVIPVAYSEIGKRQFGSSMKATFGFLGKCLLIWFCLEVSRKGFSLYQSRHRKQRGI